MVIQTDDTLLHEITNLLVNKYGCHTIILYGSRARGKSDSNSDYDIVAIREKGEIEKDCRMLGEAFVDAFIYSEDYVKAPDEFLTRIRDGKVLLQKDGLGDKILSQAQANFDIGPQQTPGWEKQEIKMWLPKMLARAERADIEGNFRRHWLLHELLNSYFRLNDLWYLGPKESFAWLKSNDPQIYKCFESALAVGADIETIRNLITMIIDKSMSY